MTVQNNTAPQTEKVNNAAPSAKEQKINTLREIAAGFIHHPDSVKYDNIVDVEKLREIFTDAGQAHCVKTDTKDAIPVLVNLTTKELYVDVHHQHGYGLISISEVLRNQTASLGDLKIHAVEDVLCGGVRRVTTEQGSQLKLILDEALLLELPVCFFMHLKAHPYREINCERVHQFQELLKTFFSVDTYRYNTEALSGNITPEILSDLFIPGFNCDNVQANIKDNSVNYEYLSYRITAGLANSKAPTVKNDRITKLVPLGNDFTLISVHDVKHLELLD